MTSLILFFVLVTVGQSRRTHSTHYYNAFDDDIWSTNQNESFDYDTDEPLQDEVVQFYDNTETPLPVQDNGDMTAKLRFYHDSFKNFTELNCHDASNIFSTSWYDPNKTTVVFTYGFTGNSTGIAVTAMINIYLQQGKNNVALLSWDKMAAAALSNFGISYLNWASPNAIKLGFEFADVLLNLSKAGLDLNKLHLVGHSLGAHLFGITGYKLAEKGMKLPWITGLDPARIGFERKPPNMRISAESASFVDIIHSDPNRYGSRRELGTVDFWPNYRNGPVLQPGCTNSPHPRFSPEDLCNHHRCWRLLKDALLYPGTLMGSWAKNFRSWKNYSEQQKKAVVLELGEFNLEAVRGNYFFTTKAESPYGLGMDGL